MELKLSQVVPGTNYRKHYDKQAMKELTASVKEHGVLQPVIVRKKGKQYELVAGERRRRASVDAKRATIPAIVRQLTDEQVSEIQAIENIQREDVNPMDEAAGFKALLDLGKHTIESLAARFGKSPSLVYSRLKLLDMPKDCQRALQDGKIELGHALALARLADKKDMSHMLGNILVQRLSVAEVKHHVTTKYGYRLDDAPFDLAACHTCRNCSTTQAALFGVDAEEARCMDDKCRIAKSLAALEEKAAKHSSNGWRVISDIAELRAARKGAVIHHTVTLKPDCKLCKERAFFYADDTGRIVWGWWCGKKKCHDEVYLGIKRRTETDSGEQCEREPTTDAAPAPGGYLEKEDSMLKDAAFMTWADANSEGFDMAELSDQLKLHAAYCAGRAEGAAA